MGEGLLALRGSCLSCSCPAGVFHPSVEGEDSLRPTPKRAQFPTPTCHGLPPSDNLSINVWSPFPPQSRKDKERLKQKHKKRPESPPSILTPPVVPTADKVPLLILWMLGVSKHVV